MFSLSFGLAWEYHDAGVLPFVLALYAVVSGDAWSQCREAASAIYRMRVPVIVALIAFAIYTNDQILEVLAMPYQVWPPQGEAIPLLSLVAIGVALWFWARFFSWFGPEIPARQAPPVPAENNSPLRHLLAIVTVLVIVTAVHGGFLLVFSAAIDKEIPFMDRAAAQRVAQAIVFVSYLSWLYFTCIFNRHLPFENNLPDALEGRPYNLQVRIVLLRLFPVALPCLLAAAMYNSVLPRIDPEWNNAKPLLGLSTISAFAVLFGVGFVFDDLCVRGLFKQRRALGRKLLEIRQARESLDLTADGAFSATFQSAALVLIGLATGLRLALVEAGNVFFNAPLVLGSLRKKRDGLLFESYFGTPEEQEASAGAVRKAQNSADGQIGGGAGAGPVAVPKPGELTEPFSPRFQKRADLFWLSGIFAAAVLLAAYRLWPGRTLSDDAYNLVVAVFAFCAMPFLPGLGALVFFLIIISPLVFFIGPFVDALKLLPPDNTLLVVNVFIAASLGFFAALLLLSRFLPRKRPAIALFFGFIVLLATFDLNDNHAIPRQEMPAEQPAQPVIAAFNDWLGSRLERWDELRQGAKPGAKHPVYIVAAQGGGAYAALHAALFLAQAQDEFPDFADHVFAISGVSGGSVGAAVFASLVRARAGKVDGSRWYSEAASSLLSEDLLTPVVEATLFQDIFARLIPCLDDSPSFCPTQALDRARRFEQTLVQAWAKRHGKEDNPFDKPLTGLWSPTLDVPALFLNTTEVETGERVVLAPFSLQQEIPALNALIDRDPELDIKLSTASGLSARFPGLTAPGWYRIKTENREESFKRRLVDGGYFENSGVATAFDLLTALEKALSARHQSDVELILISVKRADSKGLSSEPPHGFHEIMTPLRTLNNTRAARGKLALDQASLSLDGAVCRERGDAAKISQAHAKPSCFYGGRVRISELEDDEKQPLPLGWLLSEISKGKIEDSVGRPSECPRERAKLTVKQRNSCLLWQIGQDLRLGIEPPANAASSPWTAQLENGQ